MDTFFPNYNGLKISSRGTKVLTGDKSTFDYYMGKGIDVEFSPELESLISKLKSIRKELDKIPDKERYANESSLLPEPIKTLNNEELETMNKMDEINRAWTELHAKKIPSFDKLNEFGKAEGLNLDKYPYMLGSPKRDYYGNIIPESSDKLNYTWVSDPSNHSVMLMNPKYLFESINRGEYEATPEYKKFVEWLVNHKADYRKQGGILKAQKGTGLAGIPIISSLARKAAYKIITNPDVAYAAGATPKLIVKSLFSKNQEDDNKKFFLYGVDRPYRDIGEAYNWQKDIDENGYKNVKSYEGILNPYGEYLIDSKNKHLVENNLGKDLLININSEYTDPNTGFISDSTPYFDDVHGYRLKFHKDENGNIVASASDLYDFGKNYSDGFSNIFEERSRNKNGKRILEMERNALNAVGQPYILTNKYPVRFVDNPEGEELMRVRNLEDEILNNKKSGGVLSAQKGTPGFITPMINQFTTKLMEILNKYLRKDQPEQKAVGTATWAYNKPSKIVKDGGDI